MTGRQSERRKPQAAKNLEFMHKGSHLVKVRGANKTYRRFFKVDDDFLSFGYRGSKKIKWARNLLGDSEDMSKVYISEVQDVRPGPISDVFVKSFDDLKVNRSRCFSVVIGEKHKTLDLVASNKETRDAWVNGLRHLRKKMSEADLSTQQEIWMRELFRYADKNNDNSLSLKEIITLLKHLNIEVDHDQAKQIFERADTNKTKNKKGEDVLDIDEFISFYQLITQRRELVELFELYNYEGKYLDRGELKDFIDAEQYMEIEEEMCGHLIKEFEPCPTVKDQGMMALDGFNALMNSPLMDLFNVDHKVVFQDMSRPMSDYFIDSSHNTYLTADQLVGPSAVEAYIRALKRGCRCVELDCWDGDENEPVIYHGYTLTSKIAFRDVVWAINEYSFVASEYPVILSIENHCSVDQQKVMAKYFVDILGDKLYTTPYPEDMQQLPSPESLKNKILIKAKKLKPRPGDQVEDEEGDVSDEDEAAEIVDDIVDRKIGQKKRQLAKKIPISHRSYEEDEVSDEDEAADLVAEEVKVEVKEKKGGDHKIKLARELSDLVTICQSVSFKSFDYARSNSNCKQMSSFAEGKAEGLVEDSPLEYIKHNQFQFSRIYPGGLRTDSSNYDPVQMWNVGCQIVALNYQTADEPMMLNKGLFMMNGGSGYILKPDFLTSPDTTFNPSGPFPEEWKKTLTLTIISGYQLPKKKKDKAKNILDPYAKVSIYGVRADHQSVQTEVIQNNGFHPEWNATFQLEVKVPDLALVWFQVKDDQPLARNHMVAQYCLPFNSLQQGYRTIHLKTKMGEPIFGAALLVHVMIR